MLSFSISKAFATWHIHVTCASHATPGAASHVVAPARNLLVRACMSTYDYSGSPPASLASALPCSTGGVVRGLTSSPRSHPVLARAHRCEYHLARLAAGRAVRQCSPMRGVHRMQMQAHRIGLARSQVAWPLGEMGRERATLS